MPTVPVIDPPAAPGKGMCLFTLEREGREPEPRSPTQLWALGTSHTITEVNGRSFYFYAGGFPGPCAAGAGRRLLVEWRQWLSELQVGHHLWLLGPEPRSTGWRMLRPIQPQPMAMTTSLQALDRFERDQRFRRAVQQVAQRYQLERVDEPSGAVVITVTGGSRPYTVQLRPDGVEPPACTCPDAIHRVELHGGFCKHVVAALLRWPDLRHQLLAAIL